MEKEYYKAYEKRYKQLHENNLSWETDVKTNIIEDTIIKYNIDKTSSILEIGCGEGRDAKYLLGKNYNVLATDVSKEAINYCKKIDKEHSNNYGVLDVLECNDFSKKFDFIYSIACLHMLVLDKDRNKYFEFINNHLNENGYALVLTMGDGKTERSSDITKAWDDVERVHQETGIKMNVATTSCRIVNFETLTKEVELQNLKIIEQGITSIIPNFPKIMYVVIKKNYFFPFLPYGL